MRPRSQLLETPSVVLLVLQGHVGLKAFNIRHVMLTASSGGVKRSGPAALIRRYRYRGWLLRININNCSSIGRDSLKGTVSEKLLVATSKRLNPIQLSHQSPKDINHGQRKLYLWRLDLPVRRRASSYREYSPSMQASYHLHKLSLTKCTDIGRMPLRSLQKDSGHQRQRQLSDS